MTSSPPISFHETNRGDHVPVSEEQGGEVSVTANEVTDVEMEGGKGELANIKTGDQVHVVNREEKDGKNIAIKIQRLARANDAQSGD